MSIFEICVPITELKKLKPGNYYISWIQFNTNSLILDLGPWFEPSTHRVRLDHKHYDDIMSTIKSRGRPVSIKFYNINKYDVIYDTDFDSIF